MGWERAITLIVRYKTVLRIVAISGLLVASLSTGARAADLAGEYRDEEPFRKDTTSTTGFHGLVGAGVFTGESIIAGSRRKTALRPLLFLRYEDWAYISLRGGGVWLFQSSDHTLRFGVGFSFHSAYNPFGEAHLAGRDRRRSSLDGTVNAVWSTALVNFKLGYAHDLGGASNGDSASLRLYRGFAMSPLLRLTPSVSAQWESARVVDYYYGVRPDEALPDRPSYSGRETINVGAGLSAAYRLGDFWSLLGDVRTTKYGAGITESPIVERKTATWGMLGVGRHF